MSNTFSNSSLASRKRLVILLALGCLFTLLNAAKPLHIDDPFMYRVAEQIVAHPLDPYGFDIFWLQWPQPVYEELTPPVTPYWWAAALALFGERPFLWHLWLLPYGLLFAWALHALLRRLARGVELPVTAMTLISPAFLPGFNMMQDIPAMALGSAALAIFLLAEKRNSFCWFAVAGLIAGLATQAKYTAVAILAAMLILGLLRRRLRGALLAVFLALTVFFTWEWTMTAVYGRGMFFNQVEHGLFWVPRSLMLLPLVKILGGTVCAAALLGLGAAGVPRRAVLVLCAALLAGFGSLAWWPVHIWLFPFLGVVSAGVLIWTASRGIRLGRGGLGRLLAGRHGTDLFLALWLAVEIGVYFAASPFPAVRRVLGVALVATLIFARHAALALRRRPAALPLGAIAGVGIVVGLGCWAVDLREAQAQPAAVSQAIAAIGKAEPASTTWYVGHWGFQHYAEQAGMRPVVPDHSRLRRGDRLVVPWPVDQQAIRLSEQDAVLERTLEIAGFPPVRTGYGYYGGSTPLVHDGEPRLVTRIYRIRRDVVPPSDWTARQLADWALRAGGRTAAAAAPALGRVLAQGSADDRGLAARGLAEVAPHAPDAARGLALALGDRSPTVRYWAAVGLGRIGSEAAPFAKSLEGRLDDPSSEVREAAAESLRLIRQVRPAD